MTTKNLLDHIEPLNLLYMNSYPFEKTYRKIVKVDLKENDRILAFEPHIGDLSWSELVYRSIQNLSKKGRTVSIIAGDPINASDLARKGLLVKREKSSFEQMNDFEKVFVSDFGGTINALIQANHLTRIYWKTFDRQQGVTLDQKWEEIKQKIQTKSPDVVILEPDETQFELRIYYGEILLQRGLVCHPNGSGVEAYIKNLMKNHEGFDFFIIFHYHKNKFEELAKDIGDAFVVRKFYCVPPMIEYPLYYQLKGYSPTDPGYFDIKVCWDEELEKKGLSFRTILKSDILNNRISQILNDDLKEVIYDYEI